MFRLSTAATLADTALDRLIVPGYTWLGPTLRKRWWSVDPSAGALAGRSAIVTGGSSGLGVATAAGLAHLGARVHLVVRDTAKGDRARTRLLRQVPGADVRLARCDVSSLHDVRRFVAEFTAAEPVVDVLVHNAGVLPAERTETDEGHELTLATHVLGPFLLTTLLGPALAAAHDARVIFVSSGGMYTQPLRTDDPEYRTGNYRGAAAYARTKRMQVALAPLLSDRWRDEGIRVYSMHPGWAATPGVSDSLPGFARIVGPLLRSAAQGADTSVWLAATEPAPPPGGFWHDRLPRPEHYLPATRATRTQRERLWAYCREATGRTEKP